MPLSPTYNPQEWEEKIYQKWQAAGVGSPEVQKEVQKSQFNLVQSQKAHIRKAEEKDVEQIAQVCRAVWLETYPNENAGIDREMVEKATEINEKSLLNWQTTIKESKTSELWVAQAGEKIVGFILLRLKDLEEKAGEKQSQESEKTQKPKEIRKSCKLQSFYILLNFQSLGLGKKLIQKSLENRPEISEIRLNVANYNPKAISFYQKLGFEKTGETILTFEEMSIPCLEMFLSQKGLQKMLEKMSLGQEKETFTVLTPPPNLTGPLHAGHAFEHYLMDTTARVERQKGVDTLYYTGVDHAGIQLAGVINKLITKGEFDQEIQKW